MQTESFAQLQERAKELKCLYKVEEILQSNELSLGQIFHKLIEVIPKAYQLPGVCSCRIKYENSFYNLSDFVESKWSQSAQIIVDNSVKGHISVYYSENLTGLSKPFLPEEQKLLNTIADRISYFIFQRKIKKTLEILSNNNFEESNHNVENQIDVHWKWRLDMARIVADKADFDYFGIKAMYLIGSSKNGSAGPASDIDIMVHFTGNENQLVILKAWMEGWSLALSEMNWKKTGYKIDDGIIDLKIITDEDIANKDSYAIMIENTENSARLLRKR